VHFELTHICEKNSLIENDGSPNIRRKGYHFGRTTVTFLKGSSQKVLIIFHLVTQHPVGAFDAFKVNISCHYPHFPKSFDMEKRSNPRSIPFIIICLLHRRGEIENNKEEITIKLYNVCIVKS
jgi:hypothetical protein